MAARETKPNGKSQLIRDLKNGEFATLYIISGEESYMKEYYLRQLRQKVVDETFADFNLIEFEGKGLTPEMLTEAIDSYPAMADKKLIIVKDFDLFKPPAGFADVLPGVLGDLPEYVCLVFYYDVLDGKPDKRTKLYKTLEKHACFVEFAHAEEQELVAWLERRAKALGCMIEPGDASYMIFLCGNSMTNLAGEMEKLPQGRGFHGLHAADLLFQDSLVNFVERNTWKLPVKFEKVHRVSVRRSAFAPGKTAPDRLRPVSPPGSPNCGRNSHCPASLP